MLLRDITNLHRHNPVPPMLKRRPVKTRPARAQRRRTTVHSLPNEVLTEIFLAAAFSSEESRLDIPGVLSHVSSRWRAVVLNTSVLWTFVVITFPFTEGQILRAKIALARSKSRPVDVHIDVRDPEWTWDSDEDQHAVRSVDMVEIMESLGPSHPRWRSLSILTDNWEPMETFLAHSTIFSSLPSLEMLSLNRCNAYAGLPGTTPDPFAPIELFGGNAHLPKLRHVVLSGVYIDYSCSGFKDLLSLDLRHQSHGVSPTLEELRQILAASPELNSLSLVALSPSCSHGFEELEGAPVTMSHLKNLALGWWNVEDTAELLGLFRIPAVEDILLEDVGSSLLSAPEHAIFDDLPPQDSTPILGVLTEMGEARRDLPASLSSPPTARGSSSRRPGEGASGFLSRLRTLTINGVHLDPAAFSEFLPRLINLEELEMKSIDRKLIGALSVVMRPPSVDRCQETSDSVFGSTLRTLKLWLSNGGFRETARTLYEIKLLRPDLRIVNMVKLVLPEMASNGTA